MVYFAWGYFSFSPVFDLDRQDRVHMAGSDDWL